MLYLSVNLSTGAAQTATKKDSFLSGLLYKVLTFIPKANPDYDQLIDEVTTWLLEFDDESLYPEREIGLDSSGNVIMIMPFGENYGFWTDSNLFYKDFKPPTFNAKNISKDYFENKWKEIDTKT